MKHTIKHKIIALWFFLFGLISLVEASHLVGGFLTYRWLGTNGTNTQYRVTLFVYRDCTRDGTSDEVPFDDDIDLCVYSGNKSFYTSYRIKLLNSKKVQPVGNTNCPEVASACLEQGVYETTISLPNSSTGYHLKWERCCRNTQNNLKDQFGEAYQGQTYYGFIPPTSIKNSSPYFQDIPVPFICKDDTTTIRNRAVDPDGDSLSYKLVTPWQGADANNPTLNSCPSTMSAFPIVEYKNGYSAARPFGNTGIASIDAFNGLTTYLSRIAGRFAIAIEVSEWRNGVVISTVRLDLQILVINCSPNNKPSLSYEGGSKFWEIQPGEKKCWDVTATDFVDDDQIITLRAFGDVLTGSTTFTGTKATMSPATNANKQKVTSTFCWQPDCDINTTDTFRVTFEAFDDGCPSKFINENALIKVKPIKFDEVIAGVRTVCQNAQGVSYFADKRNYKNKLKWSVTGGVIVGSDTSNSILVNWGNTTQGRVILELRTEFNCPGPKKEIPINLLPAPSTPIISGPDTVCIGRGYQYRYTISNFDASLIYTWEGFDAVERAIAANKSYVDYSWDFINQKAFITLNAKNAGGCESLPDTFWVFPAGTGIPVISGPTTVCPNNDNIEYEIDNFDAKSTYTWTALGARNLKPAANGKLLVDWGNTGTGWLKVVATNRFGCKDSVLMNVVKAHDLPGQKPKGDSAFCEFTNNIPYTLNPVSGETYAWTISGGTITNGQNSPNIQVAWGARGSGFVGVKATAYDPINDKECSSKEFRLPVILHPIPTGDIFTELKEPEQCQSDLNYRLQTALLGEIFPGDSLEIETNNGITYTRVRNATSGVVEFIDVSLSNFGTFRVRARITSKFGCVGPWDEVEIQINPKPINTQLIGADVICFPAKPSYTYQVNGSLNSTFNWNITGGQFNPNPQTGNTAIVNWDTSQILRRLGVQEISDKGCIGDLLNFEVDYDNPRIESRLVTVAPPPASDAQIQFEYRVFNSPVPNGNVRIQRRNNGGNTLWSGVGQSPQNLQIFNDNSAEPDNNAYDYRAFMLNRCGDTLYTEPHTTVWLTGEKTGALSMAVAFTPYSGFENGVERYELYRQLIGKGTYELYATYAAPTKEEFNNGEDNYGQRFRIKAYELGGNRVSWSNDIALYFEPVMFVPNAFTPNGQGPNEIFKPLISGVREYEFRIYNRWGEKLAEYFEESQGWDGTYKGELAHSGIYVYHIQFRDFQDKLYQFSGTVHLIR